MVERSSDGANSDPSRNDLPVSTFYHAELSSDKETLPRLSREVRGETTCVVRRRNSNRITSFTLPASVAVAVIGPFKAVCTCLCMYFTGGSRVEHRGELDRETGNNLRVCVWAIYYER